MSRSSYSDDMDDPLALGRWRGAVLRAIRGKRGQALLRDMLMALDAMPEKRLVRDALVLTEAECTGVREFLEPGVCAFGALGQARGMSLERVDSEDYDKVASLFEIAPAMAREVVFRNDEAYGRISPEARWRYMRAWVVSHIEAASSAGARS